jgi:4-hydroxybenzoate polyprenyltransferase
MQRLREIVASGCMCARCALAGAGVFARMTESSVSPVGSLRLIASDIKLAHSVFALPFAVLGAFMAAAGLDGLGIDWSRFGGQLGLIVLAMVFARTCAMVANRLIDAEIDSRNPRTAGRALASGRLPARQATVALGACAGLFMVTCGAFGAIYGNWWPAWLGMPVLLWICAYAYMKRFTALCHVYLGSSLALSPLGAAVAVQPRAFVEQPGLWLLSGMVLCWVAGFDVIYALQDVAVDRRDGLHSMPARLGERGAMMVSRLLHIAAMAALVSVAAVDERLGWLFGTGVAAVGLLLVYEHAIVARWGTTRLALAFFTLNGAISCVLGVLGCVDIALGA